MADADLTIVILRDVQERLAALASDMFDVKGGVQALREQAEITNERLSLLERAETIREARLNVERRNDAASERRVTEQLQDLKHRVSRLEDLVKP